MGKDDAKSVGTDLAVKLKSLDFGTEGQSIAIGAFLDYMTRNLGIERDRDHERLLIDWSLNQFWTYEIDRHLPKFNRIYNWLDKHNATQKDPLVWGDADASAWIEKVKDSSRKIVVFISHCTCRDDNVYLFILDGPPMWQRFHIRTCWPKLKRGVKGKHKGWDYVEHPSLALYRREKFEPQYRDSRDKGYVLTFEHMFSKEADIEFKKVDCGLSHFDDIFWGLWHLRNIISGIEDPLEMPGKKEK